MGHWRARWGWQHRVDARLSELDFGEWDGQQWGLIDATALAAWTDAFATHAPGDGESVSQLMARCQAFLGEHAQDRLSVVGHAGWINAALRVVAGLPPPALATQWPPAVAYGAAVELPRKAGGAESQ